MTKETAKQFRESVLWTAFAVATAVACAMCFRHGEQLVAIVGLVLAVAVCIACVLQWVLFGFMRKKDRIDGLLEKDKGVRKRK